MQQVPSFVLSLDIKRISLRRLERFVSATVLAGALGGVPSTVVLAAPSSSPPKSGRATKPLPSKVVHPYLRAGQALVRPEQLRQVVLQPSMTLTPAQQRLLTANGRALKLVREGLLVPYREVQAGLPDSPNPFERFEVFRELTVLLILDGKDKAARGDQPGAVDSYLDGVQLGLDLMRGGSVNSMNAGIACESASRRFLWKACPHLTAPSARKAAQRLEALEGKRVAFADVLQGERRLDMAAFYSTLAMAKEMGEGTNLDAVKRPMQEFTKFTNAVLAKVRGPYAARKVMPQIQTQDTQARILSATYDEPTWAVFVGDQTQNALLMTALAVRAHEREHKALPSSLTEVVGTSLKRIVPDPFAWHGSLRYRLQKNSPKGYVLYSVGPDGKDNQGKPVDKPAYGPSRHIVLWESTGDIVAGTNFGTASFLIIPR